MHKVFKNTKVVATRTLNNNANLQTPVPASDFQYSLFDSLVAVVADKNELPFGYLTEEESLGNNQVTSVGLSGRFSAHDIKNQSHLNLGLDIEDNVLVHVDSTPALGDLFLYIYLLNGKWNWTSLEHLKTSDNLVSKFYNRKSGHLISKEPRLVENELGQQIREKRNADNDFVEESYFSTRFRPMIHYLQIVEDNISGTLTPINFKYDYESNKEFFATRKLNEKLLKNNKIFSFYDELVSKYKDGFNDAVNMFYGIAYEEGIWPREAYSGKGTSRKRPNFSFNWRKKREDRTLTAGLETAFGYNIPFGSMWPLDGIIDQTYMMTSTANSYPGGHGELNNVATVFHNGRTGQFSPDIAELSPIYTHPSPESGTYGQFFTNSTSNDYGFISEVNSNLEYGLIHPFAETHEEWSQDVFVKSKDYSLIPEFRITQYMNYFLDNGENFLAESPVSDEGNISNNILKTDIVGVDTKISSYFTTTPYDFDGFTKTFLTSDLFKNLEDIIDDHKDIANPARIELTANAILKFTPYKGFYPAERTVELAKLFNDSYGEGIIKLSREETLPANIRPIITALFSPGILYNSIKSGLAVGTTVLNAPDPFDSSILLKSSGGGDGVNPELYGNIGYYFTSGLAAGTEKNQNLPIPKLNNGFSKIPFESIIFPEQYINDYIVDYNLHPSGTYAQYQTDGVFYPGMFNKFGSFKKNYSIAMSNYLASCVSIFSKGNNVTSIISAPDTDADKFRFEYGKKYKMRVYLRNSKNYDELNIFTENQIPFSPIVGDSITNKFLNSGIALALSGTAHFTEPTFKNIERPYFDYSQYPPHSYNELSPSGTTCQSILTYDHDKSLYGYPISTLDYILYNPGVGGLIAFPSANKFGLHTPGYYDGFCFVEYEFNAFDEAGDLEQYSGITRKFTLDEVMSSLTASFFRFGEVPIQSYMYDYLGLEPSSVSVPQETVFYDIGDGSVRTSYASVELEQNIYDSLNLLGVYKEKKIIYDQLGNPVGVEDDVDSGERMVFSTKWQSPIFDSRNIGKILPATGYQNIARGLWYDPYVEYITDGNSGLFMQVADVPKAILDFEKNGTVYTPYIKEQRDIGSLADALGFSKEPKRIGDLPDSYTFTEGLVIIPYKTSLDGKGTNFFEIPEESLNNPSKSILDMFASARNYVLPPSIDFITYDGRNGKQKINPIVMYIFDFDYTFDRDDLKRIWNNVAPKTTLIEKEVKIGHELLQGEILDNLKDGDIRWMVFKVKQRSDWNYFSKVSDPLKDTRFTFKFEGDDKISIPDYSYNWPFDFMSTLDMAKISAKVFIESDEFSDIRRNGGSPSKSSAPGETKRDKFVGNKSKLFKDLSNTTVVTEVPVDIQLIPFENVSITSVTPTIATGRITTGNNIEESIQAGEKVLKKEDDTITNFRRRKQ